MKAALFRGDRPALSIESIPDPKPLPGSAVVDVEAVFISGSVAKTLEAPGGRMLPPFPYAPGMDTVGRVSAVAEDVAGLKPGDLVYCDHWYQSHTVSAEPDHCFLGNFLGCINCFLQSVLGGFGGLCRRILKVRHKPTPVSWCVT